MIKIVYKLIIRISYNFNKIMLSRYLHCYNLIDYCFYQSPIYVNIFFLEMKKYFN